MAKSPTKRERIIRSLLQKVGAGWTTEEKPVEGTEYTQVVARGPKSHNPLVMAFVGPRGSLKVVVYYGSSKPVRSTGASSIHSWIVYTDFAR